MNDVNEVPGNDAAQSDAAQSPPIEAVVTEKPSMPIALMQPPLEDIEFRPAVTLPNLWKMFIRMKGDLGPSMQGHYARTGSRLFEFFKRRAFTPENMVAWTEHLRAMKRKIYPNHGHRISNGEVNRINMNIRSFIQWMTRMRYLKYDVSDCLEMLPVAELPTPKIFTEEEYERIKKWCAGREWCQVHLWLIILGYRTGMTLKDCVYLRWKDVHLNHNAPSYMDIYRHKNKRFGERAKCQIPIVPFSDLHLWLLNLRKVVNYKRFDGINDYVHQDAPGHYECPCSYMRLGSRFQRIFKSVGIPPGKSFRNFRNSLCSNLVNSGVQLALVCKITGHNSVATLLRYIKPDRQALEDGMAQAYAYSASEIQSDGFYEPEEEEGEAANV